MSTVIDIADAVVTALNGATLSQSFVAERKYVPVHELDDLAQLRVSVVPATLEGVLIDRAGRNLYTFTIDVAVQKSIGSGAMTDVQINAACDPLMTLSEEIADLFDGKALTSPAARCTDVKNVPIFAPAHLDEKRVFTSVVSLTFKLGR